MSTIEQRIHDGDRARDILDNPVFHWAFDEIEKDLTESWKSSPARDAEAREKIYLMIKLLSKIKSNIETTLETGKLARLDVDHKVSIRQRFFGS